VELLLFLNNTLCECDKGKAVRVSRPSMERTAIRMNVPGLAFSKTRVTKNITLWRTLKPELATHKGTIDVHTIDATIFTFEEEKDHGSFKIKGSKLNQP
jgi:hypothetical protein